jgi:hypothetical protein
MEELPDEVAVLVLQHIEPLRDTAAVSGTCRRWRQLMLDPHLWSLFHHRTFPSTTYPDPPPPSESTNWRLAFAERARKLRRALRRTEDIKLARGAAGHGALVRMLAAAEAGCLPLAERALTELVGVHGGGDGGHGVIHTNYGDPLYGGRSVIDECLHRACCIGSTPVAEVRVATPQLTSSFTD